MMTRQRSTWPGWLRTLTTGWVLSPVIVIALLAATFEGYGYYTRHQKTTYSRGGAFGDASLTTSNSGHGSVRKHGSGKAGKTAIKNGGKHVTTLHTGAGGQSISNQGGSSHSGGGTSTTPVSTHPSGSGTSKPSHSPRPSSTPRRTAVVLPKEGTYGIALTGSEQAKFGPISPCNNKFPSRTSLVVHHAAGESARSYDFDLRLYPNQANKHDERHIYSYSKHSMAMTFEQETVTCAGIKQSSAVSYSPAQTKVQLPLTVGASWRNHGGGSARTETGTSNVVKRSRLTVGGTTYQVYEIVTKLAMTGSETGERDQTWWYAPALGMPLKFTEVLHGKRSGASYSESVTATVISTP